jgi:putative CocE/NonD family hydrolase
VIGPWSHAGTCTPTKEVGGLRYADASLIDMNELHKQWYDWTLKDGKRPAFLKQRVAYYLAEAEQWKYADSIDAISPERLTLYLDSPSEGAGDAFHSGFLKPSPPQGPGFDQYVYDPLDLRPAELEDDAGESNLADVLWGEAPTTATYARSLFGNGLVYHSDPLPADLDVTGNPRLVAWISMDVPDTDFAVVLYEVLPDGRIIVLSSEARRARYRNTLRKADLAEPGVIYRYEFNRFRFFSRRLSKGSRLRLVLHSPNSIYLQKNYNSGGVVAEETASAAKTAHIALHHDADHPSFLELPIAR